MSAPKPVKGIPNAPKPKSFGQKIFSPFGFAKGAVSQHQATSKFRADLTSQQKYLTNASKKIGEEIDRLEKSQSLSNPIRHSEMPKKINELQIKQTSIKSQKNKINTKLQATPQPSILKTGLKTVVGAVGNTILAVPTAIPSAIYKKMTKKERQRDRIRKALANPTSKYATNPKFLSKAMESLKKKIYKSGNQQGIIATQFEKLTQAHVGTEKWTAMSPTEKAATIKSLTGIPFQVSANGTKLGLNTKFKEASTPQMRKALMQEGTLGEYGLKRDYLKKHKKWYRYMSLKSASKRKEARTQLNELKNNISLKKANATSNKLKEHFYKMQLENPTKYTEMHTKLADSILYSTTMRESSKAAAIKYIKEMSDSPEKTEFINKMLATKPEMAVEFFKTFDEIPKVGDMPFEKQAVIMAAFDKKLATNTKKREMNSSAKVLEIKGLLQGTEPISADKLKGLNLSKLLPEEITKLAGKFGNNVKNSQVDALKAKAKEIETAAARTKELNNMKRVTENATMRAQLLTAQTATLKAQTEATTLEATALKQKQAAEQALAATTGTPSAQVTTVAGAPTTPVAPAALAATPKGTEATPAAEKTETAAAPVVPTTPAEQKQPTAAAAPVKEETSPALAPESANPIPKLATQALAEGEQQSTQKETQLAATESQAKQQINNTLKTKINNELKKQITIRGVEMTVANAINQGILPVQNAKEILSRLEQNVQLDDGIPREITLLREATNPYLTVEPVEQSAGGQRNQDNLHAANVMRTKNTSPRNISKHHNRNIHNHNLRKSKHIPKRKSIKKLKSKKLSK